MIDVKEVRDPMEEANEARKGWNDPFAFRDPAEMVTISADRFERMIRQNEDLKNRIVTYENQLSSVSAFIDQEAMKYAKKGRELPSWEDVYKMAEIIHWTEPAAVRFVRIEAEQKAQEVKDNAEATD